jgi:peptidoglycan hydrolase-like protein with peptidoglycan-binding domain
MSRAIINGGTAAQTSQGVSGGSSSNIQALTQTEPSAPVSVQTSTPLPAAPSSTDLVPSVISAPFTKDLALGMADAEVATLQRFLAENPAIYPQGFVTGYYGLDTLHAVATFQHLYGIQPVEYGAVGAMTLQELNRLYSAGERP